MMGRLSHDQEQFFYSFHLDEAVPDDHPVREIAAVLDLSWVHSEAGTLLFSARAAIDRSTADDPDAYRRLRVCDPIGAGAVP
jgi:hypothetical protein